MFPQQDGKQVFAYFCDEGVYLVLKVRNFCHRRDSYCQIYWLSDILLKYMNTGESLFHGQFHELPFICIAVDLSSLYRLKTCDMVRVGMKLCIRKKLFHCIISRMPFAVAYCIMAVIKLPDRCYLLMLFLSAACENA